MRKRRTLAFRGGKPEERKSLFFAVAAATAISACAQSPRMNPRRPTLREDVQKIRKDNDEEKTACKERQGDCRGGTDEWALGGERIHGRVCQDGMMYVLTDRSLLIGKDRNENDLGNMSFSPVEIELLYTTIDMKEMHGVGIVDWTASHEAAYILRADRMLVEIPAIERGEWLDAREVPFEVSNAKIAYHSGFVFVAGKNQMAVATFSEKSEPRLVSFSLEAESPDFLECDGKLFFGNGKGRVEIRINGKRLDDVQVR